MKPSSALFFTFILVFATVTHAQNVKRGIPYAEPVNERQLLDFYAPQDAKSLPVVFWIHGGGWQVGDKTSVQLKPQAFVDRGLMCAVEQAARLF